MLTKADKAWIRKIVREAVAESSVEQLGGYDGITDAHSADAWYDRKIGFHQPEQPAKKD